MKNPKKNSNGKMNVKIYETYNNERKETSFCKFKQVSDRKRQKASNLPSNRQP